MSMGCVAAISLWLLAAHLALAGPSSGKGRPTSQPDLLALARQGVMADATQIVFAARNAGRDPHWYANFGYWSEDASRMMYGPPGGRLCKLDLLSGKVTALIDDPRGAVRDPTVHYDGRKILFSWRKGDSHYYNLHEINADGTGLRQITSGPHDDIEPCYLPSGDLVFCSSRCNRWVNCWYTQVAIVYRCDADGKNIRPISSNIEHDNTPAVLPDGRILYTRWEYVDRSQVDFHHLWTFNPDGTNQMTYYGNMQIGTVMIDAKPIPGTNKVGAIFSRGHGANEHAGALMIVAPDGGPDLSRSAVAVKGAPPGVRDPYPLGGEWFLVASRNSIVLVDGARGQTQSLYTDRQQLHEPQPLRARPRERVIANRVSPSQATGRLILSNIALGRRMTGVAPGQVTKLLVLESLPKPINYSGGSGPLTWRGTFTLERVLGTVPVEPDGSAYMELPANRPVFFVALDQSDLSVKRMQSFVSVMPGETTSCVGCHEERTQTAPSHNPMALRRAPSRIQPFEGLPDVVDFPRDVQPILDRHCVACHDYDAHAVAGKTWGPRAGKVILSGDRGPQFSHSYWSLVAGKQIADGRNGAGNQPPRTIGSSASPLLRKLDGTHYGVKASDREWRTIWMWIESGATYPGTYAALGTGMVGVGMFGNPKDPTVKPPPAYAVFQKRCGSCHVVPDEDGRHAPNKVPLPQPVAGGVKMQTKHERPLIDNDPMATRGAQILFNLSRPEKSVFLLAPLSPRAGGLDLCRSLDKAGRPTTRPATVFADTDAPDYMLLLAPIRRSAEVLSQIKRFDMPGFQPNDGYIREMKRYGILPATLAPTDPVDAYATDRAYWRSFWHEPAR
jgi:hypothetical protein